MVSIKELTKTRNEVVADAVSVADLHLSIKTTDLLEKAGITDVNALSKRNDYALWAGATFTELNEVRNALLKNGMKLDEPVMIILANLLRLCPKCGSESKDHEVRNHDLMWHDGDVHCLKCGTYVRTFDAG